MLAQLSGSSFSFERTLESRTPFEPSGHVSGTAAFTYHPNLFSSSPLGLISSQSDQVLLYSEEGLFKTTDNSSSGLRVYKRYCWVWTPESSLLRVFFVKPQSANNSHPSPEDLFLELPAGEGEVRKSRHHCGQDVYEAEFRLEGLFNNKGEEDWSVRYDVHGPKKEYTSLTTYRRRSP